MTKIVIGIILIIALVALGPLLVIWSLNTLFPALAIEYTFWTWLAVMILSATTVPRVKINKN